MRWQGIGLRKSKGATTPPLLNCLAIKGMGVAVVWGRLGVARGRGGKGQE